MGDPDRDSSAALYVLLAGLRADVRRSTEATERLCNLFGDAFTILHDAAKACPAESLRRTMLSVQLAAAMVEDATRAAAIRGTNRTDD